MAKKPDFEKSMQELEQIVTIMEKGDLSLEDSLKSFERGVSLTSACQQSLNEAQQKVQILLKNQDNLSDYATEQDQHEQ